MVTCIPFLTDHPQHRAAARVREVSEPFTPMRGKPADLKHALTTTTAHVGVARPQRH